MPPRQTSRVATMLLRCIAEAVMAQGVQCLLGLVPFGERLYAIGQDARRRYRERCQEKETAERVAAAAGAALDGVRDEAREVFTEVRAAAGPEVAAQLADPRIESNLIGYMEQVPAAIRQTLRRPSDPGGETAPDGLALDTPEAFLRFLPTGLPRFRVGDCPLQADWVLEEMLGKGGFGEVWRARHLTRSTTPRVALKFCLDPAAADSLRNEVALHDILDQVQQEGEDRGIVRLRETFLRADPPCLMYEYVEGGDLTGLIQELARRRMLTADYATRLVRSLARTLGPFHRLPRPLIHRDLKPANILVRPVEGGRFRLLIADFGIGGLAARRALEEHAGHRVPTQQTLPAAVRGAFTPLYASPQQAQGDPPDPRDDVHALGVMWYQLVAGNLDLMSIPSDWREIAAERGLAADAVAVLGACLASRAESRPADAQVLADRLTTLVTGGQGKSPEKQPGREPEGGDAVRPPESGGGERPTGGKPESGSGTVPTETPAVPDLPGDEGSYVLWVGPPLAKSPRFVHFSWGGRNPMAFKIRDYTGGTMMHHPGGTKQPEKGFPSRRITECDYDRDGVWQRANLWIPAEGELFHRVQDFAWWADKFQEMTKDREKYARLSVRPRRR